MNYQFQTMEVAMAHKKTEKVMKWLKGAEKRVSKIVNECEREGAYNDYGVTDKEQTALLAMASDIQDRLKVMHNAMNEVALGSSDGSVVALGGPNKDDD